VCVYLCIYLFSVFRIVNKTSTEASLAPGIDVMVFLFSPKIYGYNICIELTKFGSSGAVLVCVVCGTLI
jgi:hypothetical protein